jgi:transposase-like protein
MSRARKYPEELLERGVRLALESERPIANVAADLGIHPGTLRKRVRQAEASLPAAIGYRFPVTGFAFSDDTHDLSRAGVAGVADLLGRPPPRRRGL